MNNYIVTFEYRVMVTAFAILAMFAQKAPVRHPSFYTKMSLSEELGTLNLIPVK